LLQECHEAIAKILASIQVRIAEVQSIGGEDVCDMQCPSDLLTNNSLEDLLANLQKKLFCAGESEVPDMKKIDALNETSLNFTADHLSSQKKPTLATVIEE